MEKKMELKEMNAQQVARMTPKDAVFEAARLFALASRRLDQACLEFRQRTQDGPTDDDAIRDGVRLADAAYDHFKALLLREFEEPPF